MNDIGDRIATSMDLIEKTGHTALDRYARKFDTTIEALGPILDAIAVAATSTVSLNQDMVNITVHLLCSCSNSVV